MLIAKPFQTLPRCSTESGCSVAKDCPFMLLHFSFHNHLSSRLQFSDFFLKALYESAFFYKLQAGVFLCSGHTHSGAL